ncbi:hypothetical protein BIU98_08380 [Curtobacterium sp. MMLR14_010]|uniref:hypothetical protein n=1 Tax=Curtobacterium sp. MMLR14_010 TaxID=1898743 RepID=UPI0008DD89E1|nr:hypothetical protein [Curtobacterium sp. MMLR14_010]OII31753.1 hypothetical protein BIU98_08380 [Curtobacterium sp. MMLR14_010]
MSDVLEVLRRHDPEPTRPLTEAEIVRADALLRAVTATAPDAPAAARPVAHAARAPRRRARQWIVVGAVTATAVVGAFSVVGVAPLHGLLHIVDGSSRSVSLTTAQIGSWTPRAAAPPSSTDVHALAVQCAQGVGDTATRVAAADVVAHNVEQRGAVTSLVASANTDGRRAWCLAGPDGIATAELIDDASGPLPAVAAGVVNLQTFGGHGDGADATLEGYGQAGTDVTSLTITVPGHAPATTGVEDGIWSLWWPAPHRSSAPDLDDITMSWTTKDGAHHSGTADDLRWNAGE